jgi:signal transduction histidine kinase
LHPDDLARLPEMLARLMSVADGAFAETEARLRAADGSWRWFRSRTSVLSRTADGSPERVLGILEDITERRELERQANQENKLEAVGQVAASIAHDFNNQLTAIGGYAELMMRQLDPDHRARESASLVLDAVERAAALTNKLLSFSRARPRAAEVVDVSVYVQELVPLLRRMVGEHVEVICDTRAQPATIEIDPSELEQVLINLAINARDAMPGGGALTLSVNALDTGDPPTYDADQGHQIQIIVSDTGSGIDEGALHRVFDPFFTTKPPGQGTGLGLASVQRIVVGAGGRVDVSSSPGKGSTFMLLFPRTSRTGSPHPSAELVEEIGGSETVLVVDDDPTVRRLERESLEQSGYRVIVARDAHQALAMVERNSIDLVVTDVMMPGISGPELIAKLRAERPDLPALLVSGYASEGQLDSVGDAALLSKPFTTRGFVTAVRTTLDGNPVVR